MPVNGEEQMSLPEMCVDQTRTQLGDEAKAFLAALDTRPLFRLRVTTIALGQRSPISTPQEDCLRRSYR